MQEDKQEHFIKNIEIKNFKCFEDFKAEGFGRVNLIGGKNNVGKTAFMEACYLGSIDKDSQEFIERYLTLDFSRDSLNFLLKWFNDVSIIEAGTYIHNSKHYSIDKSLEIYVNQINRIEEKVEDDFFSDFIEIEKENPIQVININEFYKKGEPPLIENYTFISLGNSFDKDIINFIDEVKLLDREEHLNMSLNSLFAIRKVDIIKNQVMLKKDSKYLLLSEFGDGVKHFLNIILALYLNKDSVLYLDELENGIHYTNLDKLWEIILTISKEQNVQVFATTHSKECIESYARVAKSLGDEEIGFIELGRNKKNELDSVVMDSEMFQRFIKLGNEVRGW